MFNETMGRIEFFAKAINVIGNCLISNKCVAVLKKYNLRRHNGTKHLLKYPKIQRSVLAVFLALFFFRVL